MSLPAPRRAELLAACPLFRGVGAEGIAALSGRATEVDFPAGHVIATRPLRCIVLPGSAIEVFLVEHPKVMFRMLQAQARRLRNANRLRS